MSTATPPTALAGKYLTVALADEAYGIAVLKVREIIRLQKITPVARMPQEVRGVINLRGRVIPIIDLRLKFGLAAGVNERTCIVVVQVRPGADRVMQMGLVVDSVDEVVALAKEDIEPTPEFGAKVDTQFLLGLAKVKGQLTALLDIDRVIGGVVPAGG
jgi:purine-binding chemotaxis protein CheW